MSDTYPESKLCSDKQCADGDVAQPAANFYRNDTTADGLAHYCKACMKRRAAAYRQQHPEKIRAWHRATVAKNKARNAARRAAAEDATRYVETD
jgi:hypothetical protein